MTFEKKILNSSLNFQHLGPWKHRSQELILLVFLLYSICLKPSLGGRIHGAPQGKALLRNWWGIRACGVRGVTPQWPLVRRAILRSNGALSGCDHLTSFPPSGRMKQSTQSQEQKKCKYLNICFQKRVNFPPYPRDRYYHHMSSCSNKFLRCS